MILRSFARREYSKGVFSQYLTFDEAIRINTGQDADSNSTVGQSGGQLLKSLTAY
jgi:hypothetical protein